MDSVAFLIRKNGSGLRPCSYCYRQEYSSYSWVDGRDKLCSSANLSLHHAFCFRSTSFGHL